MKQQYNDFNELFQAEFDLAEKYINGVLSKKYEAESKDFDEKNIKAGTEQFKDALSKCLDENDNIDGKKLIEILYSLQSTAKEIKDENAQLKDKITKLEKEQLAALKKINKLEKAKRKSLLLKIIPGIIKYGTLCILAAYIFVKLPQLEIALKAINAEVTAVQDSAEIAIGLANGNTEKLNQVLAQSKENKEKLKQYLEDNKKLKENIEKVLKLAGDTFGLFITSGYANEKMAYHFEEVQKGIKRYNEIFNDESASEDDKNNELKNLTDKTAELNKQLESQINNTENKEKSLIKTEIDFTTGLHDFCYRFYKYVSGKSNESYDNIVYNKQVKILAEATAKIKKQNNKLNEAIRGRKLTNEEKVKKALYDIWGKVQLNVKDPEKARQWYYDNKDNIEKLLEDRSLSRESRRSLSKAYKILKSAVERPGVLAFLKRHWIKIIVLIFFISIFIFGGLAFHGSEVIAAASSGEVISNIDALCNFLAGGWSLLWRSFLTFLTGLGIIKFIKWKFFK